MFTTLTVIFYIILLTLRVQSSTIRLEKTGETLNHNAKGEWTMKRNLKVMLMAIALVATMTSCGSNVENDSSSKATTTQVSETTRTDVDTSESSETETSQTETESNTDSKVTDETTDDSSQADSKSEKATTTTKTSEESKTETEKAVTTTKQTTTTSAVTTKPYVAPVTTTIKPVVTTKATQKPIVTTKPAVQTTKTTTKATTKQTADPTANMSPYYKALYRIGSGKGTTSDYETVRTEIINYGKKLYPAYKLNPNLHLYRLPNGKLTDDYQAGVTFTNVTCRDTLCLPSTSKEDIEYFDRMYKNLVIQNLNHLKAYNPKEWELSWYVQFSKQQIGTCVIVIAYIGDYIG